MEIKKIKITFYCLIFFFFFILIPIFFGYLSNELKPDELKFDENLFIDLDNSKADYIFIGNSMLDSRIDTEYLDSRTKKNSFSFAYAGSLPAEWYLIFKNFVIMADKKPQTVFLFFRGQNITDSINSLDYNEKMRKSFMKNNEPVFNNIVDEQIGYNTSELIYNYVQNIYSIIEYKDMVENKISNVSLGIVNYLNDSEFQINNKIVNDTFSMDKLRPSHSMLDLNSSKKDKGNPYAFDDLIPKSFFFEILKLANNNNIKIVVIKVQERRFSGYLKKNNGSEKLYLNKLNNYCDLTKYCKFYDFTGHPFIAAEMYSYTDHLKKTYKKIYTEMFFREIFLNKKLNN